jgi:putative transposase
VLPGAAYLVTRRCSERRFFLRPSRIVNEIVLYALAVAALRYGVLVHAFCVLSNHVHLVVTDPDGRLPAFMQYLDSLVARAVNASFGRFEGSWAVEPLAPADIVSKIAYVLANPVAAGLVRRGAEWPGLWTAPAQIGGAKLAARRPKVFLDPKSYMPELVELELTAPPGFASAEEFRALLSDEFGAAEAKHQRDAAAEGRRFMGAARVLAQNPFSRPPPSEPRFEPKPRIVARDKWRRIEALQRLKSFLQMYREAWLARRAGVPNVQFPAGTYLMRLMHGVQCAGTA